MRNIRRFAHTWPAKANPSPYEIFGIQQGPVNKDAIRQKFYELAKQYHPDTASDSDRKVQADRFKQLVSAYNILKNDNKRRTYDLSQAAAYSRPSTYSTAGQFGGAFAGAGRAYRSGGDDFYSRGMYEGYEEFARAKYNDEKFQQDLKENRSKLGMFVGVVTGIVGLVQLNMIFTASERDSAHHRELSLESLNHISQARANFGFDGAKNTRVERFLKVRNEGQYYNEHDQYFEPTEAKPAQIAPPKD